MDQQRLTTEKSKMTKISQINIEIAEQPQPPQRDRPQTLMIKKSSITIKRGKTSKDTKATTETQRRTSKNIQNNHSHKYYSGETLKNPQQRPQDG